MVPIANENVLIGLFMIGCMPRLEIDNESGKGPPQIVQQTDTCATLLPSYRARTVSLESAPGSR
jgi:hypothetical protein